MYPKTYPHIQPVENKVVLIKGDSWVLADKQIHVNVFDFWKFWHMYKATWNMAKSKTIQNDFKLILKTDSITIDFYFIVLILTMFSFNSM